MINIAIPLNIDQDLYQLLSEILRRSKDSTLGDTANSLVLAVGATGNYATVTIGADYSLIVTPLVGTGINANINISTVVLPVGATGNFASLTIGSDYALVVTPI